ncbi:MAG: hypothetical protein ABIN57_04215 [Chitinophagaceae bacterium]
MKIHYLFALLFVFIGIKSNSQNTITIGLEGNKITSHNENLNKVGFGLSAEYFAKLFPHGGIKGYAAINRFTQTNNGGTALFFPVRVGYQHFLYSDNLFVFGETGFASARIENKVQTGFSMAAGGGYKINMPQATLMQLSLFYNYHHFKINPNVQWITLRAAYGIKYGKRKAFKRED